MYEIVKELRGYSPNARAQISYEVKRRILWTILMQSRRRLQGNMLGEDACLRDFTYVGNRIKAKKIGAISHVEVPSELLWLPVTKRKSGAETKSMTDGTDL